MEDAMAMDCAGFRSIEPDAGRDQRHYCRMCLRFRCSGFCHSRFISSALSWFSPEKPPISHRFVVERLPFLILCGLSRRSRKPRFHWPYYCCFTWRSCWRAALVFHGELARTRPAVGHLTEFYLCLSVGGVLGGIFNSLIAPVAFHTVMEFPLVLIFAALIRP